MLEGLIGSIAAPLIGGLFGSSGQRSANEVNVAEAAKNRDFQAEWAQKTFDFQERMSSTSYQRAVGDLRSAGLNPMLAVARGGASTPSGGNVGGAQANVSNEAAAAMNSAAAAVQMMQGVAQIENTNAQTKATLAQAAKTQSETMPVALNEERLNREIDRLMQDAALLWRRQDREKAETEFRQIMSKIQDLESMKNVETFSADVERRRSESKSAGLDAWLKERSYSDIARKRSADATRSELDIPRMKSEGQFYEGLGQVSPFWRMLLQTISSMKGVR